MEGRQLIKRIVIGVGVVVVVGYSYFAFRGYIVGPQILLKEPRTGTSTDVSLTHIQGVAIHTKILTINDTPIPLDMQGSFSESVLLAPGYNIISIRAKDQYERSTEKIIEIHLERKPPPLESIYATSTATTTPEIEILPITE